MSRPLARRARVAAGAAVTVSAASRWLGRGEGSVIGGRVGLLLEPELLGQLAAGRPVALVSGTNGKTTTTRLLAAALARAGPVATSTAGANLPPGLAVALARSPAGAPAVLEVDEAYLGAVGQAVAPRVVALLNLSRDQLDRVGEVRMVANRWRRALPGLETTVVANADDPLVVWAAGAAAKVVWVAAGLLWQSDAVGCPACDGQIVFSAPDRADPASSPWACSCGFARPQPDARLVGDELVTADGRRLAVALALPGRANRANAAMAAVAAGVLGTDEAEALRSMAPVADVEGRFAVVDHGGVRARLLLAKNPAGWTELLDMLDGGGGPVVIGINARIADGHDPSWLWDVAFERLAGRVVVATGDRRRDLAVRLAYAGVAHRTVADQLVALGASGAAGVEYVGNYTAFQDLRRLLARDSDQTAAADAGPEAADRPGSLVVARNVPPAADVGTTGTSGKRSSPKRPGPSALRVVVMFPDLLGTYGDSGNGRVLAARAAWRGLAVELVLARSDRALPRGADLYCMGGGEDGPQVQAAEKLADGALEAAVADGAAVLAVCAGYQILGTSFPGADGSVHDGIGLLDVATGRGAGRRAVGEMVVEPLEPGAVPGVRLERLTGFENHAGATVLGPSARPLGQVLVGVGNGAGSGTDGARAGRVIGTYLHGPVLARNPTLADTLLALATGTTPAALDDEEEEALHGERLRAASEPTGPSAAGDRWRRLVRVGRT